MRRLSLALVSVLAFAPADPASAGSLELRVGGFVPRANTGRVNDLFTDDSTLYTVEPRDWRDFVGGVQVNFTLVRNVELGVGVDGYTQTLHTEYREYERSDGRPIRQTLKLDIVPVSAELRLGPTGRFTRVAPFLALGGDLFYWKYEEFGDFVRFSDPRLPVIEDSFLAEGVSPGFHVSGGVRFAVTDDIGVLGQARYQWGGADMGDDFRGNRLDLTGASYSLGVSIRF